MLLCFLCGTNFFCFLCFLFAQIGPPKFRLIQVRLGFFNFIFLCELSCNPPFSAYTTNVSLWERVRMRSPFPCVSYEANRKVSRCQRVYGLGLRQSPVEPLQSKLKRPTKTDAIILKPLRVRSLTQPLLHMVQHVADGVTLYPLSQHSPPPPLEFFHTLLSAPIIIQFTFMLQLKTTVYFYQI